MKIDETPALPWVNEELVNKYLKLLLRETEYPAYSIDDEYKVIKGVGSIDSNGSYNYHNNYDDSEDTLIFTYVNEYGHKNTAQKWWTLNKEEAEKICLEERCKLLGILYKQIDKLKWD